MRCSIISGVSVLSQGPRPSCQRTRDLTLDLAPRIPALISLAEELFDDLVDVLHHSSRVLNTFLVWRGPTPIHTQSATRPFAPQCSHGRLTPYVHRLQRGQCHSRQSRHMPQTLQCQVWLASTAVRQQKEYQAGVPHVSHA